MATPKKSKIQSIAEGLALLAPLPGAMCDAQHDVLYAGADDSAIRGDTKAALLALGWRWDDECESWAIFT